MSYLKIIEIYCDARSCREMYRALLMSNERDARLEAKGEGWICSKGRDYCSEKCKATPSSCG